MVPYSWKTFDAAAAPYCSRALSLIRRLSSAAISSAFATPRASIGCVPESVEIQVMPHESAAHAAAPVVMGSLGLRAFTSKGSFS